MRHLFPAAQRQASFVGNGYLSPRWYAYFTWGIGGAGEELGAGGRSLAWKMKLNTSNAASQGSLQRLWTWFSGLLSSAALPAARTVTSLFPVAAGQQRKLTFRGISHLNRIFTFNKGLFQKKKRNPRLSVHPAAAHAPYVSPQTFSRVKWK